MTFYDYFKKQRAKENKKCPDNGRTFSAEKVCVSASCIQLPLAENVPAVNEDKQKIFKTAKISFLATSRNKAGYREGCDESINKPCTPAESASESLLNSRDWNEVDVFSVTI